MTAGNSPHLHVLVCGGRNYDPAEAWNWLERNLSDAIAERWQRWGSAAKVGTLLHGGARGADEGAADWGKSEHLRVLCYPANWKRDGKAAGPIRNQRMLDEGKPDLVIAFPGGVGTADMVRRARAAGVEVIEVSP